jgi:hypothetical protein
MQRAADEEVQGIVSLVRMCEKYHTLPLPGGLFDQDAYFVYLAEAVAMADQEKQRLEDAKARVRS